jgi:hypothetical protein
MMIAEAMELDHELGHGEHGAVVKKFSKGRRLK